jgi:hypothetical protein
MLRSAAFASSVVTSMPIVLPRTSPSCARIGDAQHALRHLQHPGEHGLMRLEIDQSACPRDRRVVRRRLVQPQAKKAAERQRVCCPPRNATLGVHALEVADEQQPEAHPRQQAGPSQRRVELRTLRFHTKASKPCACRALGSSADRGDDHPAAAARSLQSRDPACVRDLDVVPSPKLPGSLIQPDPSGD